MQERFYRPIGFPIDVDPVETAFMRISDDRLGKSGPFSRIGSHTVHVASRSTAAHNKEGLL